MVQIDFINVGYGDSILMQFNPKKGDVFRILIDCGDHCINRNSTESRRISAADFLVKNGIDTIDLLILSHLHLDHVGGLHEIAGKIRVKELVSNYLPPEEFWGHEIQISSDYSSGSQNLQHSLDILSKALPVLSSAGCRLREIREPERFMVPEQDSEINITLSEKPIYDLQRQIFDMTCKGTASETDLHRLDLFINNTSLRVYVRTGDKTLMLPGDVYAAEWNRYDIPECNILKVPHHGHSDGLNGNILEKTSPEYVVISVSDDREDNCPSSEINYLVKSYGAYLFFTDSVKEKGRKPKYHESVRFFLRNGQIISDSAN